MFRFQASALGCRKFTIFQPPGSITIKRGPSVNHLLRWSSSHRVASSSSRRRRRPPTLQFSQEEPKKIMFQSLGCPRNFVDTEVMLGLSVKSGMEITQDIDAADYLVVNTCGFLESARQESRDVIQDLANHKKKNSKLLVTGCMVNLHKDQILKDFPQVDSVLGSGAIDKVIETIQRLEENTTNDANDCRGMQETVRLLYHSQDQGRLQSKPIPELVEEFQAILEHGASEIILIAQDLGDYGKDFQQPDSSSTSQANLEQLLRALLNASDDPQLWLRLLYLYPDEITPSLVDLMKAEDRICRYLDMPIQHSHDDILQLMRRKTTFQQIKATIDMLRDQLPGIHIRTSLMVGFPGETEIHFEHLLNFVQEYQLENVGVFTYSNEPMAYSSRLPNQVPEEVKEERYHRLMEVQLETVRQKNQMRVDNHQRLQVVIEGLRDDDTIVGRYFGQCPDIDGQVLLDAKTESVYAGARYWVEVTGFHEYDLIGRIVDGPSA